MSMSNHNMGTRIKNMTRAEVVEALRETDPPRDVMFHYEISREADQREALYNLWRDAEESNEPISNADRLSVIELSRYTGYGTVSESIEEVAQSIANARAEGYRAGHYDASIVRGK